jgi:hypothetical protein
MGDEKARKVASLVENGVLQEASMAWVPIREKKNADGSTTVLEMKILEAGPCISGINPEAVVLGLKNLTVNQARAILMLPPIEGGDEPIETKAVDNSAWDGDAAMAKCHSASDFGNIAFRRNNYSDPATAAAWALPHHDGPGAPLNAKGVGAALGALNGARGGAPDLRDSGAARTHLEGHERTIQASTKSEDTDVEVPEPTGPETKHAASPTYIQAAHDALVRGGAKCSPGEGTSTASTPMDDVAARLRRLRVMKAGIT